VAWVKATARLASFRRGITALMVVERLGPTKAVHPSWFRARLAAVTAPCGVDWLSRRA